MKVEVRKRKDYYEDDYEVIAILEAPTEGAATASYVKPGNEELIKLILDTGTLHRGEVIESSDGEVWLEIIISKGHELGGGAIYGVEINA